MNHTPEFKGNPTLKQTRYNLHQLQVIPNSTIYWQLQSQSIIVTKYIKTRAFPAVIKNVAHGHQEIYAGAIPPCVTRMGCGKKDKKWFRAENSCSFGVLIRICCLECQVGISMIFIIQGVPQWCYMQEKYLKYYKQIILLKEDFFFRHFVVLIKQLNSKD